MPRQLPWLNKGSGTKAQAKISSKAAGKRPVRNIDDDDDFFAGTVLESSSKGKQRVDPLDSDDELPEHPTASTRNGSRERFDRAPSSSPPLPETDLPPPRIEPMQKGIDKFNLRDDEWMMVEDEFIATAQLFTKHLKMDVYNDMKKNIAEKKKEKNIMRPIVPWATPSVETSFHKKSKEQAKKQRKAIDEVEREDFAAMSRATSARTTSSFSGRSESSSAAVPRTAMKPPPSVRSEVRDSEASDSDDLDAPRRPSQPSRAMSSFSYTTPAKPTSTPTTFTKPAPSPTTFAKPTSTSTTFAKPASNPTTFAKPALPSTPGMKRPRPARSTTFDFMDDEFTSRPTTQVPSSPRPSQSTNSRAPQTTPRRTVDILDDHSFSLRTPLPTEQTHRLAKRRADREKKQEEEKNRESVQLHDIPTFILD